MYIMITLCYSTTQILQFVSSSLQTTMSGLLLFLQKRNESGRNSLLPCELFCDTDRTRAWHCYEYLWLLWSPNMAVMMTTLLLVSFLSTKQIVYFLNTSLLPCFWGKPLFRCRGDESWQWLVVWQDYWGKTGDFLGSAVKEELEHCVYEDAYTQSSTFN